MRPYLTELNHAIWLLPTPPFTRAAFAARTGSEAFWQQTANPDLALSNLLARDAMFTSTIAVDANRHELKTLAVDGTCAIDVTVAAIAKQFGF